MSEQNTTSRRKFLQTTALIGGGLVIGFHLPVFAKKIRNIRNTAADNFSPNSFLRIGKDNKINVIVKQ
jgi:isoquinoline 1-oxidoreductase beta subunit